MDRCKICFLLIAVCCFVFLYGEGRYVGGDLSMLPAYEAAGTPYYTSSGEVINDVITYVRDDCMWNTVRSRLFVNPVIVNAVSGKREGEVQDLSYVCQLGKRIKAAHLYFVLDFHYSDTWADPSKQTIPAAWQGCSESEMEDSLYAYTKRCLLYLVSNGATPDFIQTGNETSYGMLWKDDNQKVYPGQAYETCAAHWHRLCTYYKAAARAIREICPQSQIIIHIERTINASQCVNYFNYISRDSVDYDIIGLSYYPFWHDGLNVLNNTLTELQKHFPNKPVQIVETAWYNAYYPSDADFDFTNTWSATPAGQQCFLSDLIAELKKHNNVNGLYYWFAEENGNGGVTYDQQNCVIDNWVNRGLWNPTTHQAYPGLMHLKDFYNNNTSTPLPKSTKRQNYIYQVNGQVFIKNNTFIYNTSGQLQHLLEK